MRIQVLQEKRSPFQKGTCLIGRLQSHFQLQASKPWSLQPCEHTSVLQLTRDALTLSITTSVQECASHSNLEPCTDCQGLPLQCAGRSTHLETQLSCKPQRKSFHWASDTGHKERASLRPSLLSNPRCWYWTTPKHLSVIRNHSPECISLVFCLPSKRWKMQDESSSTWFYAVNRGLFTSFILAEEPECSLERPPRGRREVVLATSRGEAGGWAQPERSPTPHHSVSPMVRCSPGIKEHAALKTNTKPEHFLLYFSYRSFVIQKRTEERAIIKPLMCY